jgi:hypothetical protein
MKVDELIGSLQNFELVVDYRAEKKGDLVGDEDLSENLVMLGR